MIETNPNNPATITGRFFLFLEINRIDLNELAKKISLTVDEVKSFQYGETEQEMIIIIELTKNYFMSANWLVSGELPIYNNLPGLEKYPGGFRLSEIQLQETFIDKMKSMFAGLRERWSILDPKLVNEAEPFFTHIETHLAVIQTGLLKVESMVEKAVAARYESMKNAAA